MREPIDLEQLAAEFADLADAPEPPEPRIDEQEILAALQAEVQRLSTAKTPEVHRPEPEPEPEPEPVAVDPFGIVTEPAASQQESRPESARARRVGLPLDQIRAWLEHVQEDLRRIEARLEQLEAEQVRLQEQHHIVAELLTSSTPA